jgi:hypothetical protein
VTTCAETRTTIRDLSPDQRALIAAVAVTPTQHATFADLAQALDWSEQKAARMAHSLPLGLVSNWVKTVHPQGVGLYPQGRTLAAEASLDAAQRASAQLQMAINEGVLE